MKKIINVFLALFMLVARSIFMSSCKKEKEVDLSTLTCESDRTGRSSVEIKAIQAACDKEWKFTPSEKKSW